MLCLLEKNAVPEEYADLALASKVFHEPVTITDFPVRDRAIYLRVTRLRWNDKMIGKTYSRDWNLVAHGTRITAAFGAFLNHYLDTHAVSIRSVADFTHLKAHILNGYNKNHLSDFHGWHQKRHAEDFVLYRDNVGRRSKV